jgi:hypothetical protein
MTNHALVVTANSGNLEGHQFLVVDMNGKAGYQAKDMIFDLDGALHLSSLDVGDFV